MTRAWRAPRLAPIPFQEELGLAADTSVTHLREALLTLVLLALAGLVNRESDGVSPFRGLRLELGAPADATLVDEGVAALGAGEGVRAGVAVLTAVAALVRLKVSSDTTARALTIFFQFELGKALQALSLLVALCTFLVFARLACSLGKEGSRRTRGACTINNLSTALALVVASEGERRFTLSAGAV